MRDGEMGILLVFLGACLFWLGFFVGSVRDCPAEKPRHVSEQEEAAVVYWLENRE